jgi:hypothetical protein
MKLVRRPRRTPAPRRWQPLLAACAWLLFGAAAESAQSVWELTPYRIRVLLAAAAKPELTPRLVEQVRSMVLERADRSIGASWDLRVEAAPDELRGAMLSSLAKLSFDRLPEECLDGDDDKLVLLSIDVRGGNYLIGARDFDLRSRLNAAPAFRVATDRALLGDEAFRAVLSAFAPLAQIESVEDKQAVLRLRAAALPIADPSVTAVRAGDAFRGVIRFNDREGKLRKLMPLDWTFLTVQEIDGPELRCNLHSGLRSPLSGRRRGKIEQLALLARPPGGSTRLELRSRADAKKPGSSHPLAGYEVYAHPADSPTTVLLGRTDGRGELTIPAAADPVRVLLIKHGGEPLARLPLMPGLEPLARAEIPDDDQRLAAEGTVTGLQENLVELVANRQVLLILIRSRIQGGKLDEAKQLMAQLRKLGRQDELNTMIDLRKRSSVAQDPRMQRKIDRLFDDTKEIINQFFDQAEVDQLETELERALQGLSTSAANSPRTAAGPP